MKKLIFALFIIIFTLHSYGQIVVPWKPDGANGSSSGMGSTNGLNILRDGSNINTSGYNPTFTYYNYSVQVPDQNRQATTTTNPGNIQQTVVMDRNDPSYIQPGGCNGPGYGYPNYRPQLQTCGRCGFALNECRCGGGYGYQQANYGYSSYGYGQGMCSRCGNPFAYCTCGQGLVNLLFRRQPQYYPRQQPYYQQPTYQPRYQQPNYYRQPQQRYYDNTWPENTNATQQGNSLRYNNGYDGEYRYGGRVYHAN